MPENRPPESARFRWIEIGTNDPEEAKRFYRDLFGWTIQDTGGGPAGAYAMLRLGDLEIGGLYGLVKEQVDHGVPSHWLGYVSVAGADEIAAKAKALGGQVVMGPMDIADRGRMAVLGDPTGAMFAVWESREPEGPETFGGLGTPCWFELATRDAAASGEFYAGLFGWDRRVQPMGGTEYTMFEQGGSTTGGMMQMTSEWGDTPSHWMIYFNVADCDATVHRIRERGGEVHVSPRDIPGVGRFAVASDPTGAYFSVIQLT